jgi:preprotein translocase subunit SecE
MTITNKRSLIALLLALVLVVSLFTVSVFAADEKAGEGEGVDTETVESTGETSDGTETDKGKTESETQAVSKVDKNAEKAKNTLIINGVIIVCIIAVAIALIIRFRKKLGEFLRSVKSELKKIVWSSKENTRKSFIVVVVVALAVAFAIFLMDTAFEKGIAFLTEIVSSWR